MNTTNHLDTLVLSFLDRVHRAVGSTCYPLTDLVFHVQKQNQKASEADVLQAVRRLRLGEVVALSSRPIPLIALRSLLDTDMFIYNVLKATASFRLEPPPDVPSVSELLGALQADLGGGHVFPDAVWHLAFCTFCDPGAIVALDACRERCQVLRGIFGFLCSRRRCPVAFCENGTIEWHHPNNTNINNDNNNIIDDDDPARASSPSPSDALVMVMGAQAVTSHDLTRILLEIGSGTRLKLVLAGDTLAKDRRASVMDAVANSSLAKTVSLGSPDPNVERASGSGIHRLLLDMTLNRPCEWLRVEANGCYYKDLAYMEADTEALALSHAAEIGESTIVAASSRLAEDHDLRDWTLAETYDQLLNAADNAPSSLVLVFIGGNEEEEGPCLDSAVLQRLIAAGVQTLAIVSTPESFRRCITVREDEFQMFSCLKKLAGSSNQFC
jgi:hypothetical protein